LAAPTAVGLCAEELQHWNQELARKLERLQADPSATLGHSEVLIRQAALELQRRLLERQLQAIADAVGARCTRCHGELTDQKLRVPRCLQSLFGPLSFRRTHGWCEPCGQWVYPADAALGLVPHSSATPLRQELSALLISKMTSAEAEAVSERLLGLRLYRSSLDREARRQGQRAEQLYEGLLARPPLPQPLRQPLAGCQGPPKPHTLVLQIDAWNIRERTDWGKAEARRRRGQKVNHWHWVYSATCFQLEQRCRKGKRRAVIIDRAYVGTRRGVDELMRRLHYEAMASGLATAERVLVVADGAVWIWNAVADRFPEAIQRLDLYHANAYLWAVAVALHGEGTAAARRWVKPLLRQLRQDKVGRVIERLEQLLPSLSQPAGESAAKAVEYYRNNQQRMNYLEGERRNEPLGSGAVESTCRQQQCRLKRTGQFWSTVGDEALLNLETTWRNRRWELLFPHARLESTAAN
jgi:hypothetical protein